MYLRIQLCRLHDQPGTLLA